MLGEQSSDTSLMNILNGPLLCEEEEKWRVFAVVHLQGGEPEPRTQRDKSLTLSDAAFPLPLSDTGLDFAQ